MNLNKVLRSLSQITYCLFSILSQTPFRGSSSLFSVRTTGIKSLSSCSRTYDVSSYINLSKPFFINLFSKSTISTGGGYLNFSMIRYVISGFPQNQPIFDLRSTALISRVILLLQSCSDSLLTIRCPRNFPLFFDLLSLGYNSALNLPFLADISFA